MCVTKIIFTINQRQSFWCLMFNNKPEYKLQEITLGWSDKKVRDKMARERNDQILV